MICHSSLFNTERILTIEIFNNGRKTYHIIVFFFCRKLFQSTQLYIKGILRWLASKSAWQIVVSLPDDLAMKLVGGVTSVNVKHLRT